MSRFASPIYRPTRAALVFVFMAVGSTGAFAQQQNIQPLLDRIERLERDIRTLNVQIARGETPTPLASASTSPTTSAAVDGPAIARLGARMDELEADLRVATGTMERVNHDLRQVMERLDKLVGDVDFRLTALESKTQQGAVAGTSDGQMPRVASVPSPAGVQMVQPAAGSQTLGTVSLSEIAKVEKAKATGTPAVASAQAAPAPVAAPAPAPVSTAPTVALPAGTPKEQYTYAFNLLRQTNYDQAEVALKTFISSHEEDPLASNARYWLGETYYVRRAYNEAAQVFFEGFSKDPSGPKAADSLLKLGMSLGGLGKADDACAAFSKLLNDFPNASSTIKNAVARERKRSSCP